MKDYIEVEDYSNQVWLKDIHLDELVPILRRLVREAEANGLTDVFLRFSSHYEPYEDWLDNPSVMAVGYREKTEEEILQEKEYAEAEALAKELGTWVEAAKEILRLQKEGKL